MWDLIYDLTDLRRCIYAFYREHIYTPQYVTIPLILSGPIIDDGIVTLI